MTQTGAVPAMAERQNKALRMKRILVPTDFSDASGLAMQHALGVAEMFGAEVETVHVVPTLVPPEAASPIEAMVRDAQQQFATFMKEAKLAWPESKIHVLYGDLLGELNAFIVQHEIDLVVIGSCTREGASRLLLGSMAEYLFRGLRAPVLVMGPQVAKPLGSARPIQHLLLCESLVPESASAMTYGCQLAESVAASVTVMHVLPASLKDSPRALQFQRMFEDELRAGGTAKDSFPQADYIVTFGDTAREIVRVAHSVHADLIVLGAKPAEMWQTHLGRGTAFRVVGDASCPILSVCACVGRA